MARTLIWDGMQAQTTAIAMAIARDLQRGRPPSWRCANLVQRALSPGEQTARHGQKVAQGGVLHQAGGAWVTGVRSEAGSMRRLPWRAKQLAEMLVVSQTRRGSKDGSILCCVRFLCGSALYAVYFPGVVVSGAWLNLLVVSAAAHASSQLAGPPCAGDRALPASGATDLAARVVTQRVAADLGQQPGGGQQAWRGRHPGHGRGGQGRNPTSYTPLLTTSSTHAISPHLMPKLAYDPRKDLRPWAHVGRRAQRAVGHQLAAGQDRG